MLRVISANLNGIRSAVNKGFLDWIATQDADFICMQELKAQADNLTPEMLNPAGYHGYFHYAEKKGYSGVGLRSEEHTSELQSLMRISYAVFCLKKKKINNTD